MIIWVKRFLGRRNDHHKDPMQECTALFKGVKCGKSNDQREKLKVSDELGGWREMKSKVK